MTQLTDFLVIGDIYIITNQPGDTKHDSKTPSVDSIGHQIKTISAFKNKLKNEVTQTMKPGIIHRPTPGELLAKDEPPIKKESDSALKETLDQIPELQKAREFLASQTK